MKRAEMTPLYQSPNGDSWFLARDPATGLAFVRHQANAPSGGQVTDIEIGAFLSGPRNPEHEALLRLIGTSILDPQAVGADDEPPAVKREWSGCGAERAGGHARARPLDRGDRASSAPGSRRRPKQSGRNRPGLPLTGSAANVSEPARLRFRLPITASSVELTASPIIIVARRSSSCGSQRFATKARLFALVRVITGGRTMRLRG